MILYKTVGRSITNTMIQWYPIIKYFKQEQWILVKRKKLDLLDMPKISKALPIIKWAGFFSGFLHITVGERKIMVSCVIR